MKYLLSLAAFIASLSTPTVLASIEAHHEYSSANCGGDVVHASYLASSAPTSKGQCANSGSSSFRDAVYTQSKGLPRLAPNKEYILRGAVLNGDCASAKDYVEVTATQTCRQNDASSKFEMTTCQTQDCINSEYDNAGCLGVPVKVVHFDLDVCQGGALYKVAHTDGQGALPQEIQQEFDGFLTGIIKSW